MVHALSGTVCLISSTPKKITVDTDDWSEGLFKDFTSSSVSPYFDKRIRAEATTTDAFAKKGIRAIVYYFGDSDVRKAVALQDLGTGPFEKSNGAIVGFHRNKRVLTLKNKSGGD